MFGVSEFCATNFAPVMRRLSRLGAEKKRIKRY